MNDKQTIMKFECLPNEILIDCFEYLNAPDIFYAFEQLNHRFYQLIRTIRLSLNFQDIHKSSFDRFCKKMLIDPTIQQQIYSLQLSNKDTHGQTHGFLAYFSLNQFIRLQSLTLIDIKENNVEQLSSMLPLLSELICFRLIDSLSITDKLVSKLPMSKPNILSFRSTLSSFQEIIPLRKLSVNFLMFNHLYQILRDTTLPRTTLPRTTFPRRHFRADFSAHNTSAPDTTARDISVQMNIFFPVNVKLMLEGSPGMRDRSSGMLGASLGMLDGSPGRPQTSVRIL
jgi:hypothetical protein